MHSVNTYACFSRKQFKTNLTRLARRRAKRHNETFEKAMQFYVNFEDEKSNLPFININSLSKGRTFKLFIGRELIEQSQVGEFTCYGLSKTNATIPWF
ncbi:MAG: type I-F CRISPR-associated endoribonuclease Cas6/Csy4 [Alteromonadaceae bacterium]|nr:type I-F CRISPR-associated endoribonuclease Cas6/Csy4 [Alteromonadaceae bacterium]